MTTAEGWAALLTLTVLEIVLAIDSHRHELGSLAEPEVGVLKLALEKREPVFVGF